MRIPAIEMVEIGAGGGSIARVDGIGRLQVGPDKRRVLIPGPAAYGRGGDGATVTDADVVLGKVDPRRFAGGSRGLDPTRRCGVGRGHRRAAEAGGRPPRPP